MNLQFSSFALLVLGAAMLNLGVPSAALADTLFPGPQVGAAITIDDPDGQLPELVDIARAPNGRSVVAWRSGQRVYLQRLGTDGLRSGEPLQVFAFSAATRIDKIDVAASNSSHVIVVGSGGERNGDASIHLKRFTATGEPITQEWETVTGNTPYAVVTTTPDLEKCPQSYGYTNPSLSMDDAGNYALIWSRTVYADCPTREGIVSSRVHYRYLPAAGAAAATPVLVYDVEIADPFGHLASTYVVPREAAVALAGDGLAIVSWVSGTNITTTRAPLLARRLRENSTDGAAFELVSAQRYVERPVVVRSGSGFVASWDMREETDYGLGRQRAWFRRLDGTGFAVGSAAEVPNGHGLIALVAQPGAGFTAFLRNTLEGWNNGRRFDADGTYLGHYYLSGAFSSLESADAGPVAVASEVVGDDYLTAYRDGESRLQMVTYGGPDGTKALDFRANRLSVPIGGGPQDVLLRWASNVEGKCNLHGLWQGQVDPSGQRNVGPWATPGERSYQMVCPGAVGPGPLNKTVTIAVTGDTSEPVPAPSLNFTLSPEVIVLGTSATLAWSGEHLQSCAASGDGWLAGARVTAGSEQTQPTAAGQFSYTLRCNGAGGAIEKTATLTVQGDATPDAFSFAAINDAAPAAVTESASVVIRGLHVGAPVTVANGEYRIGTDAWTSAGSTIQPGESVQLRLTAALGDGETRTATLTIGGISASFSVTTRLPPEQTSTATIADAPGGAVSLSTAGGEIVNARGVPTPSGAPDNRSYPHGFFAFDVENVTPAGSVTIQITLPAGSRPEHYVKCNAAGNSCSDFAGATFAANVVTVVLVDNGAGDNDPTLGRISDPGAPALQIASTPANSNSGSGGAMSLWLLALPLLLALRYFQHARSKDEATVRRSFLISTLLAAGLSCTQVMAAGTAVVESGAGAERQRARLEYREGKLRAEVEGQSEGVTILRDGKIYVIAGGQVIDMGAMRGLLGQQQGGGMISNHPDDLLRYIGLDSTGRSETVAGVAGTIYQLHYQDRSGAARSQELVLSKDARVRELSDALRQMAESFRRMAGKEATAGESALEAQLQGQGVLRYGGDFRVVSFGVQPPAESRFSLPSAPLQMPSFGGGAGVGATSEGDVQAEPAAVNGMLGKLLGNKAQRQQERIEGRAESETDAAADRAIDKVLDKAFGKIFGD